VNASPVRLRGGMTSNRIGRIAERILAGMFERFTDRARRVVVLAQEEARMLNHNYIGTEHILLGLIHEGEGVAFQALESLGISLEGVRGRVEEIIGQGQAAFTGGHIPFTPRAKKVLELSLREALQLGHDYIGTEHILLGLIREGEGVAAQVLQKLGADLNPTRQAVMALLRGEPIVGRTAFDSVRAWLDRLHDARSARRRLDAERERLQREFGSMSTDENVAASIGMESAAVSMVHAFEEVDFTQVALMSSDETRPVAAQIAAWFSSLEETVQSFVRSYYLLGLGFGEIAAGTGLDRAALEQLQAGAMETLGSALEGLPGPIVRPRSATRWGSCPRCRASLSSFTISRRDVPFVDRDETRAVEVLWCQACGTSIAAWPAGEAQSRIDSESAPEG
jgi:hypothetical protein